MKRIVLMTASLSGIFGIMMGVLMASWAWLDSNATFSSSGAVARAEAGIAKKVELLGQIRSGRYADATRQLEAWLDADVTRAAEFAREGTELSADTLRAIEAERKARIASSYEPANAGGAAMQPTFRPALPSDIGARAMPIGAQDDGR